VSRRNLEGVGVRARVGWSSCASIFWSACLLCLFAVLVCLCVVACCVCAYVDRQVWVGASCMASCMANKMRVVYGILLYGILYGKLLLWQETRILYGKSLSSMAACAIWFLAFVFIPVGMACCESSSKCSKWIGMRIDPCLCPLVV